MPERKASTLDSLQAFTISSKSWPITTKYFEFLIFFVILAHWHPFKPQGQSTKAKRQTVWQSQSFHPSPKPSSVLRDQSQALQTVQFK